MRNFHSTKELMKYIGVDSFGKCLNNKELPGSLWILVGNKKIFVCLYSLAQCVVSRHFGDEKQIFTKSGHITTLQICNRVWSKCYFHTIVVRIFIISVVLIGFFFFLLQTQNSNEPDYVSEKIYNALSEGVIPSENRKRKTKAFFASDVILSSLHGRSEERRVGKECCR